MKKRTGTATWREEEGRWRIKVQKNGKQKCFYSSTPGRTGQREANAKADAWLDEGIKNGKRKVSDLYAEWLAELALSTGTSYVEQCEKYGRYYLLPIIGDIRIEDLTEGDIQKAIDTSYKHRAIKKKKVMKGSNKPLSKKTISTVRAAAKRFVKWCRRNKYTSLNPELTIPKDARVGKKEILQPDALRILFTVDTRTWFSKRIFDDYIYAYRFAVATGLRPGEVVGLWYGDIKKNTVNLRRSINQHKEQTTGKNENSVRSFDMGQQAREAYEAQVQLLKSKGVQLNYNTPLFQIPCQRSLARRWEKYQDCNGIAPRTTLYELRHTFVSIEAGQLTEGNLKLLVGHSKNMDTLGTYQHEIKGQREQLAEETTIALQKALG